MMRLIGILAVSVATGFWRDTAHAAVEFAVTDIGALGGTNSSAHAINNAAVVVGEAQLASGLRHAFMWSNGVMHDLGTFGGPASTAYAINEAGAVAGVAERSSLAQRAFVATNLVLRDASPLSASYETYAFAVNKSGLAAGALYDPLSGVYHACNFSGGRAQDLGTLGGASSEVAGLNDAGFGAGYSTLSGDLETHPVLFTPTGLIDLGTFGGPYGEATALNNAGIVVGFASDTNESVFAFVGTNGALRSLGVLGAGSNSWANAINAFGVAVGGSETQGTNTPHAFLYADGHLLDLNGLVSPASGWVLDEAQAINDAGQIACTGHVKGEQHAALLSPVPRLNAAALAPGALQLNWPATNFFGASFSAFLLESTRTLNPGNWQTVPATPVLTNGQWRVTAASIGEPQFYRLHRP